MAKTVAILGPSGSGKTTSTVINPDGSYSLGTADYHGMNPKTHFIINLDGKALSFPAGYWGTKQNNYLTTSAFSDIKRALIYCAKTASIKSVSIDTINIYLALKEYNDRQKLTFDKWKDIANDVIEINSLCNSLLREDQIAYIFGHTMLQTQVDGSENVVFSVIGKKLTRVPPEGFYSIVIMTRVEYGDDGDNTYWFQTKAHMSSAKTPIGMFKEYEIPNSLKAVDVAVRDYYKMD